MSLDECQGVSPPSLSAAELSNQASELGKRIEVVHFSQGDIVINHDADLAGEYAADLAEVFQSGIPDGLQPLRAADTSEVFGATLRGQAFAAKRRRWAEGSEDMAKARRGRALGETVRHLYAANSVTSEVALSPKIKRLMQSREAQEIASSYGFTCVEYVEPIIAYIVRASGEKGAVYEYVETQRSKRKLPAAQLEDAIMGLKGLLRGFGIWSTDFRPDNILVDTENGLRLIDTELFSRMPQRSS